VRPFDLAAKVHTVGQARVEKRDQNLAILFQYTNIAFVHAGCGSPCCCHDVNPPLSTESVDEALVGPKTHHSGLDDFRGGFDS
jgi:hypothetical protein